VTAKTVKWFMTKFGGVSHSQDPGDVRLTDCGKVIDRPAGKVDSRFKCNKCASVRRVRASKAVKGN
jgi:hypothetical protein